MLRWMFNPLGLPGPSLGLGPGENHPAEVARRTPMDLASCEGLLWLEKHPEKEEISLIGFE